ncbi:nucleoid-structuring protein H-NS [Mongoliitalea daihaiensis]|uniref:nucleoid-structuring protein H-NS n=1 Tax=Mongoliitalea daihaiensis TaxID=2782006 RepID=UPI001F2C4243|nr:nucleoid-structuring protein H-NS [Mongoliitalea daihaiensis]UJP64318.1 nucleoid-structuring protein H-NS [Mongoliitalea daihaiensis]
MKKRTILSPVSKIAFLALIVLLSMGACKSKKKVVAPEPAPVAEQAPPPPPAPAPAQPSAEEVAVGKLENYFNSIANSSNVDAANRTIGEAMNLFSNKETPVLIVIHEESGIKDYDEPTSIEKYLHYLKDTKKNLNFISDIRLDNAGRVTELELRRKK